MLLDEDNIASPVFSICVIKFLQKISSLFLGSSVEKRTLYQNLTQIEKDEFGNAWQQ